MDRKRKLSVDSKMNIKRRKEIGAHQTEESRVEASLPLSPVDAFVPAAMDDKKSNSDPEIPKSFPRNLVVSGEALVAPKEMFVNKAVYISPENSLSGRGGHEVMTWMFKEGTVRTPSTAVDQLRTLRNPTFGRRVDYGGVYDSDHHKRENLSPGFSNISDTYARFLEKQTIATAEFTSNPYAAWRVRGKSVDQIKAQIRWGNLLCQDANTWIAGHRNCELRRQELDRVNEYLGRAVWRAPNAWALPEIPTKWPMELDKVLQAQEEIIAENEVSIMDQIYDSDDASGGQDISDTLQDRDEPLPSIEISEDEDMNLFPSDYVDIVGYSDDSDDTDYDADSDSDPEDLYSDDSSVCFSDKSSSDSSFYNRRPNFKRHIVPPPPSRPYHEVRSFIPTITDPYWKDVATSEEEEYAVREIIFRMEHTHYARKLIALGYPAINSGQRLYHKCSWTVKPYPLFWGPDQEISMLNCAAASPIPLIQLIKPDGTHCELEEALEDLSEDFEYRREQRDYAQSSLREKVRIYRSWHETRRETMLREEKEKFWEDCKAKDAEMNMLEMEELQMLMGI